LKENGTGLIIDRGVSGMLFFDKEGDYEAFERVEKTLETRPMRNRAYHLLPYHWRFVLCPVREGTGALGSSRGARGLHFPLAA
jgi:hypothetical protein